MADHPNAAVVRAIADEVERTGDLSKLTDMLADDVVWHEIGADEPIRGKAALLERMSGLTGEGSIEVATHDVIANDDHCVQLVTATATMGDRSMVYRTAEIYHMRDGKVTERWAFSDDTERINAFFGGA